MPNARRSRTPDEDGLQHLLAWVQDGVVSRRQLRALQFTPADLARMVRHKDLVRAVPGVFVNHTGRLTQQQREWVAVLVHWPAVLTGLSALPGSPPRAVVDVAIAHHRKVRPVDGVRTRRTSDLDDRADWRRGPPRIKITHALIDAASELRDDVPAAYRLMADVVQTRQTTAVEVAAVLRTRRIAGQRLLLEMLDDLATGACSVLEREWLRVERAHGLPSGSRQSPGKAGGRSTERDVLYADHDVLVELDGRAFHDSAAARDNDARRDLEARVVEDVVTIRLTYGMVFGTPCWTAVHVARLLRRGGWGGVFRHCPSCPPDLDVSL